MDDGEVQARDGADTPSAADAGGAGRNPTVDSVGAESTTATAGRTKAEAATKGLMEQVVEHGNMWKAYERVLRNKGAPGADGMRVDDLKAWLQAHWPTVKAALLAGSYLPREARAVDIPKRQGGPLSPLLSNIMLTDLDRELERRGHAFARYADDCNVYLGSRRAAEHAFETTKRYLQERLRLQVNLDKSGVARASVRDFLGYGLIGRETARLKVAKASVQRLRGRVKDVLRQSRGVSVKAVIETLNPLLRGWVSYFRCAQVKDVWQDLDGWIRRKLRGRLWRQGKRPLARARMLMKRGLTEERAWRSATNGRGAWWNAGASHMNAAFPKSFFDHMGLVSLVDTYRRFQRPS